MPFSNAKFIIFGAGSFGEDIYLNFINKNNIIGIVDNNPKQSKKIGHISISEVNFIFKVDYDYILICSEPGKYEILNQLIKLNISKEKILIAEKNYFEICISQIEKFGDIYIKEKIDTQSFLNNTNNYLQLTYQFNRLTDSIKSELQYYRNEFLSFKKDYSLLKVTNKLRKKGRIKAAFFVIWSSQFTFSSLFELMAQKKDSVFTPIIIVCKIPSISFEEDKRYQDVFEKSLKELTEKYGKKYVKSNYVEDSYVNIEEQNIDIAFFSTIPPYYYPQTSSPEFLFNKNVLLIFSAYGFMVSKSSESEICNIQDRYSYLKYFYKIYTANNYLFGETQNNTLNIKYIGYPKLDNYYKYEQKNCIRTKKIMIILAPHQDFKMLCFCGNFLKTYKLYYQIPTLYPEINFVFRPHPLLLPNLNLYWGKNKTEQFINKIISNKNVIFDNDPFYYQSFAESDAIIHDCGSYIAEYLITGKPALYLQDDKRIQEKYLNKFAKDCLTHIYQGHTLKQVCSFIDNVVIKKEDSKKKKRQDFANKNIKINYPNITQKIYEDLLLDLS